MLPDPLHPAVVHFPVVLAFLLPIFAAGALWTIRRGARPMRAWSVPLGLAALLTLSAWVAVQTGEAQEDRVERVVADAPLDSHEEAAEAFIAGSLVVLLITGAGLLPGLFGRAARVVGTVAAVGLVAGAAVVGHTGGQLVYQHGAASAYAAPAAGANGRVIESASGVVGTAKADDDDEDGR